MGGKRPVSVLRADSFIRPRAILKPLRSQLKMKHMFCFGMIGAQSQVEKTGVFNYFVRIFYWVRASSASVSFIMWQISPEEDKENSKNHFKYPEDRVHFRARFNLDLRLFQIFVRICLTNWQPWRDSNFFVYEFFLKRIRAIDLCPQLD